MAEAQKNPLNEAKNTPLNKELDASKQAAIEALEKLLEAKDHFRTAAESAGLELKEEALNRLTEGKHKAAELGEQASDYIHERPLSSLALAFVGGLLLAQFLSKK